MSTDKTIIDPEIAEQRKLRANETRRRNAEAREAQRQEKAADRVLIVNALRDVLKSPSTTVSQRLQAAQMLAEYMK